MDFQSSTAGFVRSTTPVTSPWPPHSRYTDTTTTEILLTSLIPKDRLTFSEVDSFHKFILFVVNDLFDSSHPDFWLNTAYLVGIGLLVLIVLPCLVSFTRCIWPCLVVVAKRLCCCCRIRKPKLVLTLNSSSGSRSNVRPNVSRSICKRHYEHVSATVINFSDLLNR